MAPHFSTLTWKIPWMEEPGGLQSMGSLRVGHDWATSLSRIGEGNGNPLQCSCLENPRDGGAWWAAVYGVAQSQTRLKQLSSSSIIFNTTNFSPDYKKSFFTITLINNAATNILVQVVYSQTNYIIFCYLFNIGLLDTYNLRPRG